MSEDPRLDPELVAAGEDTRNVVDRYRFWSHEAIVEDLDRRRHPFHVAIENWQHDLNIGSVVRNANAFLAAEVHIVGNRKWNRRGAMVTDRYQHVRHHPDVEALAAYDKSFELHPDAKILLAAAAIEVKLLRWIEASNRYERALAETEIPLDDKKTFDLLNRGDTIAVFQLESGGMRDLCRKFGISSIDHVFALIALYRPGPLEGGMVDTYVQRKHGLEPTHYDHPCLEPILRETNGVILYQEQVMRIANVLGGYSLAEADVLRKAVGKKDAELLRQELGKFIEKSVARGYDPRVIDEIASQVETFGRYGFPKAHSVAYSIISYQTAWLKAHHPADYMAALLSSCIGDTDSVVKYIAEARELGEDEYFLHDLVGLTLVDADGREFFAYGGDFGDAALGPGTGRAYVWSGASGERLHTFAGMAAGEGLGCGRGAGDADGDGVPDLAVGSYSASPGGVAQAGFVTIFSGATGEVIRTITGTTELEQVGFDAVGIGDVNGDGRDDLAISAANDDRRRTAIPCAVKPNSSLIAMPRLPVESGSFSRIFLPACVSVLGLATTCAPHVSIITRR